MKNLKKRCYKRSFRAIETRDGKLLEFRMLRRHACLKTRLIILKFVMQRTGKDVVVCKPRKKFF